MEPKDYQKASEALKNQLNNISNIKDETKNETKNEIKKDKYFYFGVLIGNFIDIGIRTTILMVIWNIMASTFSISPINWLEMLAILIFYKVFTTRIKFSTSSEKEKK